MKPRIVLATIGSLGDLHPFMALGLELRARGADVVLAGAAEYRTKVERGGLCFEPLRPSFDDMQQGPGGDRAQLTRAVVARGDFLLRRLIVPHVRESYEDMLRIANGAHMVLTSSLSFGARLAAERLEVPWMGIVLQPLLFLSAYDPPALPGLEWLTLLLRASGPVLTAGVLRVAKRGVDRWLKPIHALRGDIGLAPSRLHPLFEGQFSALGAIGLYSKLLGDIHPDYPRPTRLAGFAWFDSDDGAPTVLGESLQRFMDAGSKPLVFTLGSFIVNSPGSFYHASVAAAAKLGKRAVLLVGESSAADYAPLGSDKVHICGYAPHSLLFARAEAIVHHGGIGTLAQALRAGVPQLVVPFFADQLDNAERAVKLGVARSIAPRRYDAGAASSELTKLMDRAHYRSRAKQVGDSLLGDDGAVDAAEWVLKTIARGVPPDTGAGSCTGQNR